MGGRTTAVLPSKKKKKRFVVKKGSISIKIYPTPPGWTVTWISPDGRQRKYFGAETKAREFAGTIGDQLSEGITKVISAEDMASLQRAREILRPFGISIELAAAEWAKFTGELEGVALSEAVRFFRSRRAKKIIEVSDAVSQFLTAKRQDKKGDRHIEDLESRLGRFAEENPGALNTMTPEKLDGWLRGLRKIKHNGKLGDFVGPQTRNHYRAALSNLFTFADQRRWITFTPSEFTAFAPAVVERGEVGIFTPAEAEKLLTHAKELAPALVFGFFSGLRPSEIQRLKWEDVDLDAGHVFVRGKVRTARYRIAPLPPNAIAWLSRVDRRKRICEYWLPGDAASDLAARLNLKWIHDGPRHSFVSYRLAVLGDLGKVSEETGTSVPTLRLHYRKPIAGGEAAKYFAIFPPGYRRTEEPKGPAEQKTEIASENSRNVSTASEGRLEGGIKSAFGDGASCRI